jgi:hypothetical protein
VDYTQDHVTSSPPAGVDERLELLFAELLRLLDYDHERLDLIAGTVDDAADYIGLPDERLGRGHRQDHLSRVRHGQLPFRIRSEAHDHHFEAPVGYLSPQFPLQRAALRYLDYHCSIALDVASLPTA